MAEKVAEAAAASHRDQEGQQQERRQARHSDGGPTAAAPAGLRTVNEDDLLRMSTESNPTAGAFTSGNDAVNGGGGNNEGHGVPSPPQSDDKTALKVKTTSPWGGPRLTAGGGSVREGDNFVAAAVAATAEAPHPKRSEGLLRAASRSAASYMGLGNFFEADVSHSGKRTPESASCPGGGGGCTSTS
jgi:hypothetical protein